MLPWVRGRDDGRTAHAENACRATGRGADASRSSGVADDARPPSTNPTATASPPTSTTSTATAVTVCTTCAGSLALATERKPHAKASQREFSRAAHRSSILASDANCERVRGRGLPPGRARFPGSLRRSSSARVQVPTCPSHGTCDRLAGELARTPPAPLPVHESRTGPHSPAPGEVHRSRTAHPGDVSESAQLNGTAIVTLVL